MRIKERLRQKLDRLEEVRDRKESNQKKIHDSIDRDRENLREFEDKISNLFAGQLYDEYIVATAIRSMT
ncbi:MAG: hypothetical protein A6F71_10525 [Cycloclasticus sp. symbiont of Poecilosclerida sp. M]|nr:MAG: hypothetical protein A6F71_10525 [Cycloclasticus sp. symbiont of Poecilosclerida sp. M]